jgi:hypothetical protein
VHLATPSSNTNLPRRDQLFSEIAKPTRSLDAHPQIVTEDLYLVKGNDAFRLGETEAAIWKLCDGKHTLGEIAISLAMEFDVPAEQVIEDVRTFVTSLDKAELVTFEDGG